MKAWEKDLVRSFEAGNEDKIISIYKNGFPIEYPLYMPWTGTH
jgi:hypothetical protein